MSAKEPNQRYSIEVNKRLISMFSRKARIHIIILSKALGKIPLE